ncbi:MAG: thiamine ABC transporter substrate-binding protein [Chloroflexota bacterium]|nr:thiamine ABC transporter substrate-binding protein [Chloroflexota bacterium]
MRRLTTALTVLVLAACQGSGGTADPSGSPGGGSPGGGSPAGTPRELVVMTHDSFSLPDELVGAFEAEQGVTLRILRSGDAGSMVNQAILSRGSPLADVLFGVDSTFLTRALAADIFLPYGSPELAAVPADFKVDDRQRVTPIDHGEVCLNIDREAFAAGDPPAPQSLQDLTLPEYRGMSVVQDPASSSVGLAFLLATVARFGEGGWRDYWAALRENDVLVADGWEDAYYGRFSGGAGEGDRPIVVSYASSPAAEVVFAESAVTEAPTAVVLDGCYRQVEFAGILQGTEEAELAGRFIDYLLSRPVQEAIPLEMFVYPVRGDAVLPEAFVQHAQVVEDPLELPMDVVEENRQRWIAEWTETVLR